MKVKELKELLKNFDDERNVFIHLRNISTFTDIDNTIKDVDNDLVIQIDVSNLELQKDFIRSILQFNLNRDLLNTCSIENEFRMLLEELFELVQDDKKHISELISKVMNMIGLATLTPEKQLDALIDIIYIAIGSMAKIIKKHNPTYCIYDIQKIIQAGIQNVCEANSKKGLTKNHRGKITKAETFEEPKIPVCLEDLQK